MGATSRDKITRPEEARVRGYTAWLLLFACARGLHPVAPAQSPDGLLARARNRATPQRAIARFSAQLIAPAAGIAGGTNGAWVVDPPHRAHLALFGLLGSPILTLTDAGTALAVDLPKARQRFSAAEDSATWQTLAGAGLSADDWAALLCGDLPLDDRAATALGPRSDGTASVSLPAADGWTLDVVLRADGTLAEAALHREQATAWRATFDPYAAATLGGQSVDVPTRIAVQANGAELEIRFRSWKDADPLPPVFGQALPDGWAEAGLDRALAADGWLGLLQGVAADALGPAGVEGAP